MISTFQFLSRNSVRWDPRPGSRREHDAHTFQFLSRNSVRWDEREDGAMAPNQDSFNSSVGILSVGTEHPVPGMTWRQWFQFLSRNSVRWDLVRLTNCRVCEWVSIPQSEFCPLGLQPPQRLLCQKYSFQFLSRNSVRWDPSIRYDSPLLRSRFQFLSRNSVRWD